MGDQHPIGEQHHSMPEGARETDYTKLSGSELLRLCSDDPHRWAAAFMQTAPLESLDHDYMAKFLGDVIEHSADVRRARAAERGPRKGDR